MRFRQQARVVTSNSKVLPLICDWFEETLTFQIKQHKLIFGKHVLLGNSHTVYSFGNGAPKVFNAFETRVAFHNPLRPIVESRCREQAREIAGLNRRVTDQYLAGLSLKCGEGRGGHRS
jgi:hypothetical protein